MSRPSRNPKLVGERAECAFLFQALSRGLAVSQPFGDSCAYDAIVDRGPNRRRKRLVRVQVRSTNVPNSRCFRIGCRLQGDTRSFTPDDIDFLAAWVVPYDAWYIIPAHTLPTNEVKLFPHVPKSSSRTERYREAWHLLGAKRESQGKGIAHPERYKKSWLPPAATSPDGST
ncbi:MAG TPA: group I intron-associated PD-(D/E)XK endonuclease [Terriglobales bacterium]|nr:group I intron-associated PD-(D/E)XK endonuclease [Terriglobales bacterium]